MTTSVYIARPAMSVAVSVASSHTIKTEVHTTGHTRMTCQMKLYKVCQVCSKKFSVDTGMLHG